jgi:hypothetical protein
VASAQLDPPPSGVEAREASADGSSLAYRSPISLSYLRSKCAKRKEDKALVAAATGTAPTRRRHFYCSR